jgi:hypothetical protein
MRKMNWRENVDVWPVALSVALLAILAGLTCNPSAKKPSLLVVVEAEERAA